MVRILSSHLRDPLTYEDGTLLGAIPFDKPPNWEPGLRYPIKFYFGETLLRVVVEFPGLPSQELEILYDDNE